MHECKNEERLRKLENTEAIMSVKLENLIDEMKSLVVMLKGCMATFIFTMLGITGFLITYWVKK